MKFLKSSLIVICATAVITTSAYAYTDVLDLGLDKITANNCSKALAQTIFNSPSLNVVFSESRGRIVCEPKTPDATAKIFCNRLLIGGKNLKGKYFYRTLARRKVKFGSNHCSTTSSLWLNPKLLGSALMTTNLDCGHSHCSMHFDATMSTTP